MSAADGRRYQLSHLFGAYYCLHNDEQRYVVVSDHYVRRARVGDEDGKPVSSIRWRYGLLDRKEFDTRWQQTADSDDQGCDSEFAHWILDSMDNDGWPTRKAAIQDALGGSA
jgi:hypothetical protein